MDMIGQLLNLAADSMDDMFFDENSIDDDEMNDMCLDDMEGEE